MAAQNTITIAFFAVLAAATIGGFLGLVSGYSRTQLSNLILRLADVIMSFPSLLLAVIVLYMLEPSIFNLVIVLAITRVPGSRAGSLSTERVPPIRRSRSAIPTNPNPPSGRGPRPAAAPCSNPTPSSPAVNRTAVKP